MLYWTEYSGHPVEKYKNKDSVEITSTLFEKKDSGTVTGNGKVKVSFEVRGNDVSFTDTDKADIINYIQNAINNPAIEVSKASD